jgi:hypothetical protein
MNFIVIVLLLVAAFLLYKKQTKFAMIAAAIAVLWMVFGGLLSNGTSNGPLKTTTVGGVEIANDTCGCAPGQQARVFKRNLFGSVKFQGLQPCAVALGTVSRNSKKWSLRGCA